ncbi:MAG: glycosyl hydrolase family 18 protein [Treponema sp.]|nr:glycosyl hydrolase family 18 protein [Treponema sp.]
MVGYFPSWSGDPQNLQFDALTQIDYAFLAPTPEGGYAPVHHPEKLEKLVALAHARGVKVLASVGGWTGYGPSPFDTISSDPVLTLRFVLNTLALIDDYDLDGLDIDWEFPSHEAADRFAVLIHALAADLHAAGKVLTIAVSATYRHGDAVEDGVIADVDFLDIMAYDDGVGGPPGVPHSSYAFAERALNYWLVSRDVPACKAVLGVPFYGRSLKNYHARTFRSIVADDPSAPAKDLSRGYAYNGFATIRAKTMRLARERAGGIMIWQIAQDAAGEDSLLNAIYDAIKRPIEYPLPRDRAYPVRTWYYPRFER